MRGFEHGNALGKGLAEVLNSKLDNSGVEMGPICTRTPEDRERAEPWPTALRFQGASVNEKQTNRLRNFLQITLQLVVWQDTNTDPPHLNLGSSHAFWRGR